MLKQGLNQKLLQRLSPQQIQYIQLLQLNTEELEMRLEEELADNPALEEGTDHAEQEESPEAEEASEEGMEEMDFEDASLEDVDMGDYLSEEDEFGGEPYQPSDPNEEHKEIPVATQSSLHERLMEQLGNAPFSEREYELGAHLIGMLEDDGYLRRPLRNLAYDLAFLKNLKTDETELEGVLERIQHFDPPGIAARDLRECLLIQLRQRSDIAEERFEVLYKMIDKYLDALANKHYDKLMKALDIDREQLRESIELISHLNPKPGDTNTDPRTQYIVPDFTLTKTNDGFHIALNGRNAPELRVNTSYEETVERYQKKPAKNKQLKSELQYIKQKLDSARWFIDAVKQRQNTLLQTMKTIVHLQKNFFETGDEGKLRPMILKDVADRVELDISTISRVVNSKYVETDFGIFALKYFFSEGITKEDGEEVSNREVKQLLQAFISQESKKKPLTDDKLTAMLKERGYQIARRTVAKYREQLDIPVARLRKEL